MNKRHKKESDKQESHHVQQFRSKAKALKTQQVELCLRTPAYLHTHDIHTHTDMWWCVCISVCTCMFMVSLLQSKELKRFKDKLKEEEKLALKTAELQAPKDGKKQYMNGVKAQCNGRRLKRVHV